MGGIMQAKLGHAVRTAQVRQDIASTARAIQDAQSSWVGAAQASPHVEDAAKADTEWQRFLELQRTWRSRPNQKFLHCMCKGGLAQFMASALGCVALGMLTDRALVFDYNKNHLTSSSDVWRPESYSTDVWSLFDRPEFQGVHRDRNVSKVEVDVSGAVNLHEEQLLCTSLQEWRTDAGFQTQQDKKFQGRRADDSVGFKWASEASALPLLLVNSHVRDRLLKIVGSKVDEMGIPAFEEVFGPRLFRLRPLLSDAVQRVLAIAGGQRKIGLQIRVAPWGWVARGGQVFVDYPDRDNAPFAFVRCAYAAQPLSARHEPSAFVVASDSNQNVWAVLITLVKAEGRAVHATNAGWLVYLQNEIGLPLL